MDKLFGASRIPKKCHRGVDASIEQPQYGALSGADLRRRRGNIPLLLAQTRTRNGSQRLRPFCPYHLPSSSFNGLLGRGLERRHHPEILSTSFQTRSNQGGPPAEIVLAVGWAIGACEFLFNQQRNPHFAGVTFNTPLRAKRSCSSEVRTRFVQECCHDTTLYRYPMTAILHGKED